MRDESAASGMGRGGVQWIVRLSRRVQVGHVDPGDSVWWHPDIIHGVEAEHRGAGPRRVVVCASYVLTMSH